MVYNTIDVKDIKDDTLMLSIDVFGGLSDRILLGKKGLIENANATIQMWKFTASEDDKDIQNLKEITGTTDEDLENALCILNTDNFDVSIIQNGKTYIIENAIVGTNFVEVEENNKLTLIDINKINFNDRNIYSIF